MNKKTKYITASIIAITCLLLTSTPAITRSQCGQLIEIKPKDPWNNKYIELEPNDGAEISAEVVHGASFGGYISSNVLVRVTIYNNDKLIYDRKKCEHDFGGNEDSPFDPFFTHHLKGGDLNITVTNPLSERIGVDYYIWTSRA